MEGRFGKADWKNKVMIICKQIRNGQITVISKEYENSTIQNIGRRGIRRPTNEKQSGTKERNSSTRETQGKKADWPDGRRKEGSGEQCVTNRPKYLVGRECCYTEELFVSF